MTFEFEVTVDDLSNAHRVAMKRVKSLRMANVMFIFLALAFTTITVAGFVQGDRAAIRMWPVAAILLVLIGAFPLLQRWGVKRAMASNPSLKGLQRWTFAEDGISMTGTLHQAHVSWEAIVSAVETRHSFLFYYARNAAYFLPTRVMTAAARDELRRLLGSRLPGRVALLESTG